MSDLLVGSASSVNETMGLQTRYKDKCVCD